jgi:hypothetical protein
LNCFQYLPKYLVQALAMRLKQLREEMARARRVRFPARPGTRHVELPRDRGDLDAGQQGSSDDVPFRYSTFGQAWRSAASVDYGVVSHLQLVAEREKR